MLYPRKKYRKGFTIYGVDTLLYEHLEKGRWVYLRDRVIHPSFIKNMTLMTVKGLIDAHLICEAVDQQQEYLEKKWRASAGLDLYTTPMLLLI